MTEVATRERRVRDPACRQQPETSADSGATSAAYGDAMSTSPPLGTHVVVVGAGMVAHRFVDSLLSRSQGDAVRITVLGEEPRHPYDRVGLTGFFGGSTPDDLTLGPLRPRRTRAWNS